MSVYSHRFALAHLALGDESLFVVPAGATAVIRDMRAVSQGNGSLDVYEPTSGADLWFIADVSIDASYHTWTGRQVLNAGEELRALLGAPGPNLDLWISGYLLYA